jgi:hypothetical protein
MNRIAIFSLTDCTHLMRKKGRSHVYPCWYDVGAGRSASGVLVSVAVVAVRKWGLPAKGIRESVRAVLALPSASAFENVLECIPYCSKCRLNERERIIAGRGYTWRPVGSGGSWT